MVQQQAHSSQLIHHAAITYIYILTTLKNAINKDIIYKHHKITETQAIANNNKLCKLTKQTTNIQQTNKQTTEKKGRKNDGRKEWNNVDLWQQC